MSAQSAHRQRKSHRLLVGKCRLTDKSAKRGRYASILPKTGHSEADFDTVRQKSVAWVPASLRDNGCTMAD